MTAEFKPFRGCGIPWMCALALVTFLSLDFLSRGAPANGLRAVPPGLVLYVSTRGNDAWSGRLAVPNQAGTDGPLATVGKARDRIREIKAVGGLKKPVAVLLRSGVFRLPAALVFTTADSGTAQCPITYQSYPGEHAVLSGGVVIRGWQPDASAQSRTRCNGKLWRADLPGTGEGGKWRFNQLFVHGQRRVRARKPNKGSFLRTDGPAPGNKSRAFYFQEGDVKEWKNLRDVLLVVYHSWETSLHHVRYVDMDACAVTFHEPAPWPMGRWERRQRYYVENVFEELDAPGEWYFDYASGTLYYYPLPGEDMTRIEVVAPRVTSTLIQFKGDPSLGRFVEYLRFQGLSFEHTNSNLKRIRNPGQGEIYQPALVMAVGLRHANFENCEIAHTGAHAVWMADGCADNRIQHCHIHDLGGGGVYVGGGWGIHETTPAQRVVVDNNFIHDGGYLFHGAHGVWIGRSSFNTVTHNEISNFDYSGISCGWSWGFAPSSANHNNLDYNHIHHLSNGDGLSDMGGIYTLGVSPGTTERYNRIHDVYNYAHVSHGSGIYPDEGSSDILIENNVVYRVRTCPLFQHYGKDNIVRNNILAFGGKGQLQRCREDKRCNYAAERNIVYAKIREMLGGVWKNGDWKLGSNLYWSTSGEPTFKGMDFAAWQKKGYDVGSMVADPLFVDPDNGDFRLKPNSPALKLGYKPIDFSQTGLYGERDWVNLPKQYPNRPLNELPKPAGSQSAINLDFEADELGQEPLAGKVVRPGKGASLLVSTDTAVSGTQSLKFTDAPGQRYSWTPHIYYNPSYATGKVLLSWDMFNTKEAPASFYVEVRQWNVNPYLVGPTVSVAQDGTVTASDQKIGSVPLGEWVHVDIALSLGNGAPKTYQLTLRVPSREPTIVQVPFRNQTFQQITWLGISSTTETTSVFYLDNLKLGTAEELAKPVKKRPKFRRSRSRTRTPDGRPPNGEKLLAHWTFDEGGGYLAADSSGYGNDGDVWGNWAKGKFGSAIFCDQTGVSVSVPDSRDLHLGESDFSIELWICPSVLKIDSKDPRRRVLEKSDYPRSWWNLNITSDGKPFLELVPARGITCANRPRGRIPEKAWTHLAIVVDRANRKTRYYFNGKLDSAQDIPASFKGSLDVAGHDLSLGSGWQPFVGMLDEVKVYKRTLSATEIKADFDKEKGKRTSVGYELVE